jgi:hypothetical protein
LSFGFEKSVYDQGISFVTGAARLAGSFAVFHRGTCIHGGERFAIG